MQKSILLIFSLFTLGLIGCKNKAKEAEEENITYFKEDDKEMNNAISKAKAHFSQFEKAFSEGKENNQYYGFTIKEGFPTEDGGKEHMWIGDLSHDGTNYIGVLANKPIHTTEVKLGDTITINTNNLSDWMYFDSSSNLAHGGYTIRVYIEKMNDVERQAFLEESGLDFAPIVD